MANMATVTAGLLTTTGKDIESGVDHGAILVIENDPLSRRMDSRIIMTIVSLFIQANFQFCEHPFG